MPRNNPGNSAKRQEYGDRLSCPPAAGEAVFRGGLAVGRFAEHRQQIGRATPCGARKEIQGHGTCSSRVGALTTVGAGLLPFTVRGARFG